MFPIFSFPRSEQLVCQFKTGRGKAHLWFQFRAAGLRGQAGRCPSGVGQVSAPLRLNAQWWLLHWCGSGHGGVVINISPGLIPLVHKQRFEAAVGTKHKGLWVSEGNWAQQPLYNLRFVWPAGVVSPREDGWAVSKGPEQQKRAMEQWLAQGEIWRLNVGTESHRALLQIDWVILLHCVEETKLKEYFTQTFYGENG